MRGAFIELTEKLILAGMSVNEIDDLIACFLQEEAFDYVKYICNEMHKICKKQEDQSTLS